MSPEQKIANDITTHGHSLLLISDHAPPFIYTAGLMFTQNHPELILFGLPPKLLSRLLPFAIAHLRQGNSFADRTTHTLPGLPFALASRTVHPSQHEFYLGYAMGYCREQNRVGQLQALQLFFPDQSGRFPFDPNCDDKVWHAQPRLDQPIMPDQARAHRRDRGDL